MDSSGLIRLFSAPVRAAVATASMYHSPLIGAERMGVAGWAPKRMREFAAGRAAARLALLDLGEPIIAIPKGRDGAPVWPHGIVGSISHCEGFCAAVLSRQHDASSLGFDVETAEPLPADLHTMVFSPDERSALEAERQQSGGDLTKVGFSAKEAFYKSFHPLAGQFLDFRDVVVRFFSCQEQRIGQFSIEFVDASSPSADLAACAVGRWWTDRQFVYTGVTLVDPQAGAPIKIQRSLHRGMKPDQGPSDQGLGEH
jgi:enterobactin synthetase component D / holo-[acyl-carrier protein] synthase